MTREEAISALKNTAWIGTDKKVGEVEKAIMMAIEALKAQDVPDTNVGNNDLISRSDAIDAVDKLSDEPIGYLEAAIDALVDLPSAQPEIIRCKDCEFGEQDEVGRWFCRSLGCQIGNEDGSGFCADAERRTDEQTD